MDFQYLNHWKYLLPKVKSPQQKVQIVDHKGFFVVLKFKRNMILLILWKRQNGYLSLSIKLNLRVSRSKRVFCPSKKNAYIFVQESCNFLTEFQAIQYRKDAKLNPSFLAFLENYRDFCSQYQI